MESYYYDEPTGSIVMTKEEETDIVHSVKYRFKIDPKNHLWNLITQTGSMDRDSMNCTWDDYRLYCYILAKLESIEAVTEFSARATPDDIEGMRLLKALERGCDPPTTGPTGYVGPTGTVGTIGSSGQWKP